MSSTSGYTKKELAEIASLVDTGKLNLAFDKLDDLLNKTHKDEVLLILPELRRFILSFYKKKQRLLNDKIQSKITLKDIAIENSTSQYSNNINERFETYNLQLQKLEISHIFQWATYYRDTVSFILKDLINTLEQIDSWDVVLKSIADMFLNHSSKISQRGIEHSLSNGLDETLTYNKTTGGLQQFIFLIINLYAELQTEISTSNQSNLIRKIVSSMLSGVLTGYKNVVGWDKLCNNYRHWVPAIGFLNGNDAITFIQERDTTPSQVLGIFNTTVPLLLAIDNISEKLHDFDYIYPTISKVQYNEPLKLDISWSRVFDKEISSFSATCIFSENIEDIADAESLLLSVSDLVVLIASPIVNEWIEKHAKSNFIDSSIVNGIVDNAIDLSEVIASTLQDQLKINAERDKTGFIYHNYAKDFPLEDPEQRKFFYVDRHSVKNLLEQFENNTGIHLWCSVRRSGKTTAATSISDVSSRSMMLFQTMDHVTELPHQNIFEQEILLALSEKKPIPSDFFENTVNKCLLAYMIEGEKNKKIIFVLDEYETFFGLLEAYAQDDLIVKFSIALPLLSQMVRFSAKNLLIFMGQRPDAFYILPAQNQLSPLVKQHNFPLFEHFNGSTNSEFSQFLKKVLSPKLPFTTSFNDAVYSETSGHPYLTVNLMVDFCDWLIDNNSMNTEILLDGNIFQSFSSVRLTTAALSRSTFYQFFQSQLNSYIGGGDKKDERWLYAITKVLSQIARKHPKKLMCSLAAYNEIALQSVGKSEISTSMLLSTGLMSNFLKKDGGYVKPAIKLMARLAACSKMEIK
ncbi:hypothetical protein L1C56_25280 [Klebsiella pneumoniae]|jgi:hypothetical protein|uniref:hypothetical protein n=1 Tax=Klebsiella pneumoniae TaxID=573 RepID=UPI00133032E8|nr:hypothetical protein [Klebsiella pneumoniae]HDT4054597.1 hypothetical protein [Klebsiella pneumoniae subsp. pneumoniae]MBC4367638.1 hypothetical protein [Klebsiella pneumoniae]MCB3281153.1 hypothetical protein [Klebsiella pneumoniae]MCF0568730.1 hypothetical protein [Klebsiella pneumoniae]MCF0656221.1 hypothetical protein [Klebsiella pneumoniae]